MSAQHEPMAPGRAGALVLSIYIDELGPGRFLVALRTYPVSTMARERPYVATTDELLAAIRRWLGEIEAGSAGGDAAVTDP